MEENLSEKLQALLADPEAVAKIAAIASSLGAGAVDPPAPEPSPPPSAPALSSSVAVPSAGKDPRLELLRALRPLVAEQKQKRIDDLMQIATVASLLGNFGKRS